MCVLVIVCEPDEDVHRVHCKICTAMLFTECAVRVVCVCALCVRA